VGKEASKTRGKVFNLKEEARDTSSDMPLSYPFVYIARLLSPLVPVA
jgi:hypothetical protein